MDLEAFIAEYGYIGIFVGSFLEGETTVLIGGILSKLGYMNLERLVLWAFIGTLSGDCTFFFIGRAFGKKQIEKYKFISTKLSIADRIIHKYGKVVIFTVRFLVGIRTVILLLLGCTSITKSKFLLYSLLNSILWSIVVAFVGYACGNVVYVFVKDVKRYEEIVIPSVIIGVSILIVIYRLIMKEKEKEKAYGD